MRSIRLDDPAGLGRGRFTRWLPVLWQAGARPPSIAPVTVRSSDSAARFLLRVLMSAKRFSLPAGVLASAWQIGEALVPLVAGIAIDRALATGDLAQLALWLVVLALVLMSLSLGFRFAAQLTELATQTVQLRLRLTLSRAVLHNELGLHPDGSVVSLMTTDVTRTAMVGLTVYPVAELVGVIFIAVSLLVVHWPLGLAVLAGAPVAVAAMGLLSGRLARDTRRYQTLLAQTVGRATDLISGYRVLKGIHAEREAARRYRTASRRALHGAVRNTRVLGRFLVGSSLVSGVFVAGAAALAACFAVVGQLSVGELIAAVGLTQALLPPLQMIAVNAVPAWAGAIASGSRILDALSGTPTDASSSTASGRTRATSTAPEGVPVLELRTSRGTVLRVEPGELLVVRGDTASADRVVDALMQPTGAHGLLPRVDGVPADPIEYPRTVVVSPAHASLFSGTAADNLAVIGASAAVRDAALSAAGCMDFLGAGLDMQIGEQGGRLSGGQRQRLALARALATTAPVLVLQDPTTAVDSVTDQFIAEQIQALRRGRTTILVTSSPALTNIGDRVIDPDESHD